MNRIDPFVADLFRVIDARDAAAFARAFAEDGTFRFGNLPPVAGRREIEGSVSAFFAGLAGLRHEIQGVWTGVWEGGEVKSVETTVTYTRPDATVTRAIPATSTLRMQGTLIGDFRIFADLSPLFAKAGDETLAS